MVQAVNKSKSQVEVRFNGKSANGKSLIQLMALGVKEGETVFIEVDGEDEIVVIKELTDLLESVSV